MKIYLAGSQRSGPLREELLTALARHEVIDPATHGLIDEREYTAWDLRGVEACDVLVAFMEPSNPSGYGLCLEVGYARGLGRHVVFVDQMGDDPRRRYFGMVRAVSTVVAGVAGLAKVLMEYEPSASVKGNGGQGEQMKVYLCGPINGRSDDDCKGWREYAKERLADTLDPMDRDYRGRELEPGIAEEIVENDKQDILGSDVLLVYFDKPSVGTSMEILFAHDRNKQIVLVDKSGKPLSPWLKYHCPVVVQSLDEGIAACK